ncbi:MAG: usg protein [Hyphomicrobiaceae bacterium]
MARDDFTDMLQGYSLTTAEILYRLPDHPALLQSYIWQEYDLHPRFPRLRKFLDFWEAHLEGPLFKVTVSHRKLIGAAEFRIATARYALN